MKRLLFGLLIANAANLLIAPCLAAPAVKVPPLKICVDKFTGNILAKKKCLGSETTLTSGTLPTGPQGPQGAQGLPGNSGVNGTVDPTKCHTQSIFLTGTNAIIGEVNCNASEYLLTHGVLTDDYQVDINEIALLYAAGKNYPQGVRYTTRPNVGTFEYTMTVSGVCCLP